MKQKLVKKDLFWLFATPIYLIIGTFRHEASHAISAILEGVKIREFVFWPTIRSAKFFWGYVLFSRNVGWVTIAAPYICDLLTYLIFFIMIKKINFKHHWKWVNLLIIGLISPIINSAYNYIKGINGQGDVSELLVLVPDYMLHLYFIITLFVYILGLYIILKSGTNSDVSKKDKSILWNTYLSGLSTDNRNQQMRYLSKFMDIFWSKKLIV